MEKSLEKSLGKFKDIFLQEFLDKSLEEFLEKSPGDILEENPQGISEEIYKKKNSEESMVQIFGYSSLSFWRIPLRSQEETLKNSSS